MKKKKKSVWAFDKYKALKLANEKKKKEGHLEGGWDIGNDPRIDQ